MEKFFFFVILGARQQLTGFLKVRVKLIILFNRFAKYIKVIK